MALKQTEGVSVPHILATLQKKKNIHAECKRPPLHDFGLEESGLGRSIRLEVVVEGV